MSIYLWVMMAMVLGLGVGIGFALGRNKNISNDKVRQLEVKLENSTMEIQAYREKVNSHFGKTAQLFNQLTQDYRNVYEHLAESAQSLCDEEANNLLKVVLADKKVLEGEAADVRVEEKLVKQPEPKTTNKIKVKPNNKRQRPLSSDSATVVLSETEESSSLEAKVNEARMIH